MSKNLAPDDDQPSRLASAGKLIGGAGHNLKGAAQNIAQGAAGLAGNALDKASDAGDAGLKLLRDHPQLLKWLKPLGAAGLVNALEKVDIDAALSAVRDMQAQYPHESPGEIAQRLTIKKAIYAGGVGLATNAVPGVSLLLAPIDWAMSASLQAELAYQIAAAYGQDLRDPKRQGEIAGIFALAFGGAKAAGILGKKIVETRVATELAGRFAAKKVPLFGAAIGAGTNAMMLFALGQAAKSYYEKKSSGAKQTATNQSDDNDDFLLFAAEQDDTFQRILTHIARAGNPDAQWTQIENELKTLGLNDVALQIMADEWMAPHQLEDLLAKLDCAFSLSLLAQSRRIAELDGTVSPQEQQIMSIIEKHCNQIGAS